MMTTLLRNNEMSHCCQSCRGGGGGGGGDGSGSVNVTERERERERERRNTRRTKSGMIIVSFVR